MAIPFSTSSYRGQIPAEYEEALERFDELTELIESEAVLSELPIPTKTLGADSTSFTDAGAHKFITEHLIPTSSIPQGASEQSLMQILGNQHAPAQAAVPAPLPLAIEDKNITANYLFSLNPLNQVKADVQKRQASRSPKHQSTEHSELLKFIREGQREAQEASDGDQERELGPMIEAMTNDLPQVAMALPGGVELRFVMSRDGKVSVTYEMADGVVRTLSKGKTLRLDRWVNGVTVRTDGTIALTP